MFLLFFLSLLKFECKKQRETVFGKNGEKTVAKHVQCVQTFY